MATGVLPVCVGKATRMGQFLPSSPKEYIGEIRFGFSTNTYDREGMPTSEARPLVSPRKEIEEAMRIAYGHDRSDTAAVLRKEDRRSCLS